MLSNSFCIHTPLSFFIHKTNCCHHSTFLRSTRRPLLSPEITTDSDLSAAVNGISYGTIDYGEMKRPDEETEAPSEEGPSE